MHCVSGLAGLYWIPPQVGHKLRATPERCSCAGKSQPQKNKRCTERLWHSACWAARISCIMWASSSSKSRWKPRRVSSKWIFHYDLLKYCNSESLAGKAPDPLSLLFWTSTAKPCCWISLQVSHPNTNLFCLLSMKFYVTAVLLMSLSHIYSFQPRTCTLCLWQRETVHVPLESITRRKGSYVQIQTLKHENELRIPQKGTFWALEQSHRNQPHEQQRFSFFIRDTCLFPCRGWACSRQKSGVFRKRSWVACNTWCLNQFPA